MLQKTYRSLQRHYHNIYCCSQLRRVAWRWDLMTSCMRKREQLAYAPPIFLRSILPKRCKFMQVFQRFIITLLPEGVRSIAVSMAVCLLVCLSVCPSARITGRTRSRTSPNSVCTLTVAVARSSSEGVAICYVLPVLWMTSCFHTAGQRASIKHDVMFRRVRQVAVPVGRQAFGRVHQNAAPAAGGRARSLQSTIELACIYRVVQQSEVTTFEGSEFCMPTSSKCLNKFQWFLAYFNAVNVWIHLLTPYS